MKAVVVICFVFLLAGCNESELNDNQVIITLPSAEIDRKSFPPNSENNLHEIELPGNLFVPPIRIDIDSTKLPASSSPELTAASFFLAEGMTVLNFR